MIVILPFPDPVLRACARTGLFDKARPVVIETKECCMSKIKIFVASVTILFSCLSSRSQTTEVHSFTNLFRVVPDGNAAGLSDRHSVTSSIVTLSEVRLKLSLNGEFNGDLYAYLRHIHSAGTNF